MKDIKNMTLKEKIGQLVVVGFSGYQISEELKELIEEYKVGNVILFTRNIENIRQLHDLNQSLHEMIKQNTGIMPFISIDQEGGMVTRIMKEATFFPGNMSISACGNVQNAYLVGEAMGRELRALGINMNLAPSLDVNNNPANPVIGVRSYGDDPKMVAQYGLNYIEGLQAEGVVATAKHFPGHGDTESDSHHSLPVIPHNKERLDDVELYPFKQVINKTKAIMSAHVFFEAYEEGGKPATLSEKVMTDLLRKQLGFEGLIISDCMEMKAIDATYTASYGAVLGLKAGLDQVIISATPSKQFQAMKLIAKAVEDGLITEKEIDEKVQRILKLKEETAPFIEQYFYKPSYQQKEEILKDKKTKQLAEEIVDNSLTLVKGKSISYNKKTLVIATEPFAMTIAEDEFDDRSICSAIKERKINVDTVKIDIRLNDEEITNVVKKATNYQQVVICTYNALTFTNQAKLIRKLHDVIDELFVVSTRSPYDIFAFPQIKNYLCLYEYTPNSVQTFARFLEGDVIPLGKLPISLNEKVKVGASLYVGLDQYKLQDNIKYLEKLKEANIDKVFISAHMPEMKSTFLDELKEICEKAKQLDIKIILDVAKHIFNKVIDYPVYAFRLDYGFSNQEIVELANELKERKIKVELNASTINENDLLYFKQKGINLSDFRISHNFYPKKYTGLSRQELLRRNAIYKKYGLKIMMYIPCNEKRPPMFEGLPTVEEHRNLPLEAILSEIRALHIDEVFFGDAYASKEELEMLANFSYDTITIPTAIVKGLGEKEKNLLLQQHRNRLDASPSFVRSSTRLEGIKPHHNKQRKVLDVTIDNEKFLRYQGEVCIMMEDLPQDERVNVVGVAKCSQFLLEQIKPGSKFTLKIIGEIDE